MPRLLVAFLTVAVMALAPTPAPAAEQDDIKQTYQRSVSRAINYLLARQAEDGSFSQQVGPSITALAATSLLRHGRSPNDPAVAKALKYLEGFVQPDGGIYDKTKAFRNYDTCLCVMCFSLANEKGASKGKYDKILKGADAYLKGIQWDGGETVDGKQVDKSSPYFGGAGYGKHKRPDLSNTQMFIDALKSLGNDKDDPHVKNALIFVNRCQNLESEFNTTPFAGKINDGGLYYTPAAGGSSQAGETPNGGLRSYASMTYAGLKSMIFCGVKQDDPRVKAAIGWLQKHYDLKSNPGLGTAGLYYYYHTFAKALDALGHDEFVDDKGKRHNWRHELITELASRQQKDGGWINVKNERWLERDGNLVTAYALLALSYCKPK